MQTFYIRPDSQKKSLGRGSPGRKLKPVNPVLEPMIFLDNGEPCKKINPIIKPKLIKKPVLKPLRNTRMCKAERENLLTFIEFLDMSIAKEKKRENFEEVKDLEEKKLKAKKRLGW